MKKMNVVCGVFAMALMGAALPVVAQDTAGSKPAGAQAAPAEETSVKGELVGVDTTAKTISIRAEGSNSPTVFAYSDSTKVSGAGDSVTALSSMKGSNVTIHFTKQTPNNVATRVEVAKKST
jgi:hypothetical protein